MNNVEEIVKSFREAIKEQDLIISEYYKRKERIEQQKKKIKKGEKYEK